LRSAARAAWRLTRSSLCDTAGVLANLRAGVETLQAAMRRVRAEVAEPHSHIASRTRQVAALSRTVELLHAVIRVLKLCAKLRESLGAAGDSARAAKTLAELQQLLGEADLAGVVVVDAELAFIAKAAAEVRGEAAATLQRGLDSLSQSECGAALQILANLGELGVSVERCVAAYAKRAGGALAEALEASRLGAAGGGGGGGAAAEALWGRLDGAVERVHAASMAVWHLQKVLAKKRDPVTHALFLDEVAPPGAQTLFDRFWQAFLRAAAEQFARAHGAAGSVRDALTQGYPRLLALLDGLHARLLRDADGRGEKGVPAALRKGDVAATWRVAEPFAASFLARSLQRLTDAVNAAFPAGGGGSGGGGGGASGVAAAAPLPGAAETARLCTRVQEELAACAAHPALLALVAQGCGKALRLFAERCEFACAGGADARALSSPCTPQQARTLSAAAQLESVHACLSPLLAALPAGGGAAAALSPSLDALQAAASEALQPLFRSAGERVEACLAAMHAEAWGAQAVTAPGGSAASIQLQELLALFSSEYLSRLQPAGGRAAGAGAGAGGGGGGMARVLGCALASRTLTLFVRHASLLRPLSEAGRLRLATDMAEVELALAPVAPLESLGAPYRALRALRPLLFLETEAIAGSPLIAELPSSALLHHLLSRAPPEVLSPHVRAGLTPAKYASWLAGASEADVVRGVAASLDAAPACADDPAVTALRLLLQRAGEA